MDREDGVPAVPVRSGRNLATTLAAGLVIVLLVGFLGLALTGGEGTVAMTYAGRPFGVDEMTVAYKVFYAVDSVAPGVELRPMEMYRCRITGFLSVEVVGKL